MVRVRVRSARLSSCPLGVRGDEDIPCASASELPNSEEQQNARLQPVGNATCRTIAQTVKAFISKI